MPTIPKLSLDTDYITDDIKDLVGVPSTVEENSLVKGNTINYLSNINHLIISYKELSPFNKYYPSILLDDIKYHELTYNRSLNYSNFANRTLYTMYLDDLVKYGIKNKDIDLLYSNYDKNNYLSYDNKYTGINKDKLLEYLNNELTLSYSSIDNYYKCGFKYYLSNILKIDEFEETFYTIIGSLFHYVLSKMNENDFDLEYEYNNYLKDKEFNNKEKFFLDKLKNDLKFIIDTIRKHQFISGFTNMLYEHKIDIKLMNSPYVHFKGFVDKIMYQEKDNETLVSIIDYKTGNTDIKIKNLKFGLSMQLPIYLYLVNNSNILKNIKFTGFYLQHILNVDLKKGSKKTREEANYDNLKLLGYSTSDLNRLSIFDSTYENSEMIRSMKLNNDGSFSRYANTLSDEEINEVLELTHERIINAMNNILEGNFDINPKLLNNKNVSCEYCKFKDICYHDENNNVYLENGGDDNA
jgi:ATP-dependent helicase/DNAse subunit B